jgi:hypothetical protein
MNEQGINGREPGDDARRRGEGAPAAAAAAADSDDAQSEPGINDESFSSRSIIIDSSESEEEDEEVDADIDPGSDDEASSDGSSDSEVFEDEGFNGEIPFDGITFGEAVELLEESEGPPIESMTVSMLTEEEAEVGEDGEILNGGDFARAFRRFVTVLGRGEGGRAVKDIKLYGVYWQWLPEADVERLFAEVLPSHPTLEELWSDVPAEYVKLLTSALPTEKVTPLVTLGFFGPSFDHESAKALTTMISRNVAIESIILEPLPEDNFSGGLDAGDLKLICQAIPCNTKLRTFIAKTKEVLPDTLDGIATSSSLRHIMVYSGSTYPDECLAGIARQLKANTTMEHVFLRRMEDDSEAYHPDRFRPIEEVLETHNFTLRTVVVEGSSPRWDEQDFVDELLDRNARIQQAITKLTPTNYHVEPTVLVPRLFGMVSSLPALVYRFLRNGNVDTVCDLLQEEGLAEAADDADADIDEA